MISKAKSIVHVILGQAVLVLVGLTALTACTKQESVASDDRRQYPAARQVHQVDNYHGAEVADSYRWMEEMESAETSRWLEAQEKLFNEFVDDVPVREAIKQRIMSITNVATYTAPVGRGGRYFFSKTGAGKTQAVVYMQKTLKSEPKVLLDPYALLKDKELRFVGFSVSPDGRRMTYRVTRGQSVWSDVRIMDVDSQKVWTETLSGVSSTSWTKDGNGFYYVGYDVPDEDKKNQATLENPGIYFHKVGTPQAADLFIYAQPEHPTRLFGTRITHDGRYLIISVSKGSSFSGLADHIYYKDLNVSNSEVVQLIKSADGQFAFEGSNGTIFILRTTLGAPRNRLIAVDITNPNPESWRVVVPEAKETLTTVSEIGDRLVLRYNRHARPVAKVYDFNGKFQYEVDFPTIALVGGFPDDRESPVTFYQFWGLFEQGTTYRLDVKTGKSTLFRRPKLDFHPDDFMIKQVFYESKDGTRVPMFIAHKKSLKPGATTPAFMYAYGAMAWSGMPWYQPHILAWMELGGVYAFPNIRGGGEYGDEWYKGGILHNKQNGIDDYIAAAEWLIENNYTSAAKMIADGQSASGVLAGAAIVQRPDLFGASLIDHPRLDMLRYHLFTGGTARVKELGSPEDPEQFKTLFAYSPYHNLKRGTCYPATLVVVGEQDEVTPPLHGYKFTAALQAAQGCEHPALIKVVRNSGHVTYGTTPDHRARTWADIWSFFVRVLDMEVALQFSAAGSN